MFRFYKFKKLPTAKIDSLTHLELDYSQAHLDFNKIKCVGYMLQKSNCRLDALTIRLGNSISKSDQINQLLCQIEKPEVKTLELDLENSPKIDSKFLEEFPFTKFPALEALKLQLHKTQIDD